MTKLKIISLITVHTLWGACMTDKDLERQPGSPTDDSQTSCEVADIIIFDCSLSAEHLHFSKTELEKLIASDVHNGVTLTGIRILPQSNHQAPFVGDCLKLDTLELTGSYIERAKKLEQNKRIRAQFSKALDDTLRRFGQDIIQPQVKMKTDINGALRMATQIANHAASGSRRIRVIIISDFINDPLSGSNAIQPVQLPEQTEIFIIGNDPEIDVKSIFPYNEVVELPSFNSRFFI